MPTGIGFTKPEVISYLKRISPPTPTDNEHPATWWNEQFGRNIRNAFDLMMNDVVETIANAKEE